MCSKDPLIIVFVCVRARSSFCLVRQLFAPLRLSGRWRALRNMTTKSGKAACQSVPHLRHVNSRQGRECSALVNLCFWWSLLSASYCIFSRFHARFDDWSPITTITGGSLPVVNVNSRYLHITLAGIFVTEIRRPMVRALIIISSWCRWFRTRLSVSRVLEPSYYGG